MWPAGLIASTASGVEYKELTHAETQRRKGRKNSGIFTTKGRSESREWDFQSAEICAICGPPILCGFCDLCGQILFFVVLVYFVVNPLLCVLCGG